MKIVQVHKYWWHRDGASNYALDLSTELEKRGHTVIPFAMSQKETLKTDYNEYFVSEMSVSKPEKLTLNEKIKYAGRMVYSTEAKKKMAALLDATKPDIVHFHNIYHHISPSIIFEIKKRGIPMVMTLHDYKLVSTNYSLFHHGKIQEKDHKMLYLNSIKNKSVKNSRMYSAVSAIEMFVHHKILRVYKKINTFIAPSQFMMKTCAKFGWKQSKFKHIEHPIDTSKYTIHTTDLGYVAYIGRLSEEKGLHVLLEAARRTPDIQYKIVGTGPLEAELKTFVQKHHMKNVLFTGFKTGSVLKGLIKNARIISVPSIWYENYPLSILEAKAMGKIVIGSDIGGIPELLEKRFLVKHGDAEALANAIKKWHAENPKVRRSIGLHNRTEVERINNVEHHIDRVEGLYKDLVK